MIKSRKNGFKGSPVSVYIASLNCPARHAAILLETYSKMSGIIHNQVKFLVKIWFKIWKK